MKHLQKTTLMLIALALLSANADAAKKKSPNWQIRVQTGAAYNNNILKYADKYWVRFVSRREPERFHVSSLNDVTMILNVRISRSHCVFGRRGTFSAGVQQSKYVRNAIKDWRNFTFGFTQALPARLEVGLRYNNIPNFYIRHYRGDDLALMTRGATKVFRPLSFGKQSVAVWIEKSMLRRTRALLSLSYMRYTYNPYFSEYNSTNLVLGLNLYQGVGRRLRLHFGYQRVGSAAGGLGQVSLMDPDATVADASYDENLWRVGFRYQLFKMFRRPVYIYAESLLQRRDFTTSQAPDIDPTHAGRIDNNTRISLTLSVPVGRYMRWSGYYKRLQRSSGSSLLENRDLLASEKDYQQSVVAMRLTYYFSL